MCRRGRAIPPGSPPDTTNSAGLGGRFNSDQCLACHSHPAPGGTSPAVNPSFAIARHKGATNQVPFFERLDGPTREVRFQFNDDGTRDGSVHQKFTVTGRSDAPDCRLAQPDFEQAARRNGLSLPHPDPAVRARADRLHPRHGDPGAHGGEPGAEGPTRYPRHPEPRRQQQHHRSLRLEGAERLDRHVRRRGLQRRDGSDQRAVPHLQDRGRDVQPGRRAQRRDAGRRGQVQRHARGDGRLDDVLALHPVPGRAPARGA